MANLSSPIQRIPKHKCTTQRLRKYCTSGNLNNYCDRVFNFCDYRPGHEGSIKNGAIDPLGEYLATSGCDGHVNIYKLPSTTSSDSEDESSSSSVHLVKKIKITKAKTQPFD